VVYVTHDQVEAMTLADRVVVMHQGRVEQAARPLELYERPANTFVAAFIGAPSMNFVPARVAADGHGLDLDGGGWVHLPAPLAARLGGQAGRPVTLGVRPEHLAAGPGGGALPLLVREVEPLGPHQLAIGELANARFVAQLPPHWPVKLGEPCPIVPDPNRLHLFDPQTGRAI
jgi:multiple sugar transport system ATP-binding protein